MTPPDGPGPRDQKAPAIDSLGDLFLIMFAKGGGYAAILILALVIFRRARWSFSVADVLFWLCVVAIPIARHRTSAMSGQGGPATPTSVALGILAHLGIGALVWAGAHSIHFG